MMLKITNKFDTDESLELILRGDSTKLDGDVNEQLTQSIFEQLAEQSSKQSKAPAILFKSHFWNNKLAMAASVVLSILTIQYFFNPAEINNAVPLAQQKSESISSDKKLIIPVTIFGKQLVESDKLQQEYLAIIADVEKLKSSILTM